MSPHYDPPTEGYTTAIPSGVKHIREGIAAFFGITRHEVIRDYSRCQHQNSEHCVCRGVDWYTTDIAKGTKMRKFLIFAADKLGIQAAIFNNIVWGYGRWEERSPASSPHTDHVHGGINKWGAKNVTRAMVDAALAEWSGQEGGLPVDQAAFNKLMDAYFGDKTTKGGAMHKATFTSLKNPATGQSEDVGNDRLIAALAEGLNVDLAKEVFDKP